MPDPLRTLQSRHARALYSLMNGVRTRRLTPQQATGQARTLFRVSHALAAAYGTQRGGGSDEVRRQVAGRAARTEMEFLRGMIADAKAGRYAAKSDGGEGAKALRARAALYALKLTGTANEAWGLSQPADEVIHWRLGAAEHCGSCLSLAAGSPYTRATMPTWPALGDTECLVACKCVAISEGGAQSFSNA